VGSFDSLNPHIRKGRVPWQLRFLAYESLLGRNYDEPFTLYGLLAESVEVPEDRSWVEFTLNPAARFSDGSPVTVEDVLWSFETLGTEGHPRYAATWDKVASAEAVGERTVRFEFNVEDDELPLIMGLRPILKKAQWDGVDFAESGLDVVPISSAPYVITDFDAGRFVLLERNEDYWGADVPIRRGTNNLDQIRMEFFADGTAMFEAFKGGVLNTMRETNVQKWDTVYDFPAVEAGDVVRSIIPHQRPTGLEGLVFNTRREIFADWRVREALITAFNFEFINATINGDPQPRIPSVFGNSVLGMEPGAPATGKVAEILSAHTGDLLPGAIEGYSLPVGDGTERNRRAIRTALALMEEAGWTLQDGVLKNAAGEDFTFEVLLQTGASEPQQITDIYVSALERIGIFPKVETADSAQFNERTNAFDFDMTWYRRGVSLSPGNEQALYWGSEAADVEGSRNIYGIRSPAIDAVIAGMLTADSQDDYRAGAKALDRLLMSGRYFIPTWHSPIARLAHAKELKYRADRLPMYGDWIGFQPDVWWYEE
ncbi:MAG: extracellular solute-binding protein, partial [Pseudomonadota bacterium]